MVGGTALHSGLKSLPPPPAPPVPPPAPPVPEPPEPVVLPPVLPPEPAVLPPVPPPVPPLPPVPVELPPVPPVAPAPAVVDGSLESEHPTASKAKPAARTCKLTTKTRLVRLMRLATPRESMNEIAG
jgi:hypothetical protein